MFWNMRFLKKKPADTAGLTKAFGWNTAEVFTQQDVQEFSCILMDSLEKKAKEAESENFIEALFKGQMENYIKCKHVDYKSSRLEDFYDIQLPVKGHKSIYDSLDEYTSDETLEGENQYAAEGFGKQDALKGLKFTKLPPVLMLHLRRFEYDWRVDANVKIMDKLEIYEEIDMSKYLTKNKKSKNKDDMRYQLFGILIHQGVAAGSGHYITYIRPGMGQWYKFNDETVKKTTWEYVKSRSEGGKMLKISIDQNTFQFGLDFEQTGSTAYELVYMRKSEVRSILAPITEEQVPRYVRESVEEEIAAYRRKEFLDKHFQIFITSPDTFEGFTGAGPCVSQYGMYDSESLAQMTKNPLKSLSYIVKKNVTVEQFLTDIENKTNMLRETYQVYKYNKRSMNWVVWL